MDSEGLSADEKEFLEKCEAEFKDRFTERDEEYMKVVNRDPPTPPILENWLSSNSSGRRHDRRYNNRHNTYDRYGNRDRRARGDYNRHGRSQYDNRGYNDYHNSDGYHSRY
ncbi:RNA guanine-N7 methyltransferase activating subunit-like [Danaus plexippus]|uniref:Uncharacterized protein n=1 Tax=Danaus plexippus plexippus TaxID=278856 RepID=A0A212FCM5_DANPL|nr:RNA guanine-N7 methyltransferase activating subunit-like [Danaus plexippus]OWR51467.1 hypothetical protein KGM_204265 [Danaus plexippus plexippus]